MKGIVLRVFAAILSIGLCAGCVTDKNEPAWSLEIGDKLPEFYIVLNTGEEMTTEYLKGKKSVIIFFTTTCEDCQRALPGYQRWYEEIQNSGEKVKFFCVSRDEGAPSIEKYWEDHGFTMPYSAQTDRKVYNLFASSGVPRVYVANPNLIITEVRLDE